MDCKGSKVFNKAKINTDALLNSKAVIYTNEAYKRKSVLISILEDFIDSSQTYSRIFIAIVRKTGFFKNEEVFLVLLKYEKNKEIPIWLKFDNIDYAVNFVENTVITLGNVLLSVENRQLINSTPRFSHLYPPDPKWLKEQLFLKIPQYRIEKIPIGSIFMRKN